MGRGVGGGVRKEGWGGGNEGKLCSGIAGKQQYGKKIPILTIFSHSFPTPTVFLCWPAGVFFLSIGHMEFVAYWMLCSTIFLNIDLTVNFCYYVTKKSFHRIIAYYETVSSTDIFQDFPNKRHCCHKYNYSVYCTQYSILR